MAYRFVTDLPREEYEAFLQKASLVPLTQRPGWETVKSNWGHALSLIHISCGSSPRR